MHSIEKEKSSYSISPLAAYASGSELGVDNEFDYPVDYPEVSLVRQPFTPSIGMSELFGF